MCCAHQQLLLSLSIPIIGVHVLFKALGSRFFFFFLSKQTSEILLPCLNLRSVLQRNSYGL